MSSFIEECQEWLVPKGYTVHHYTADKKMVVFTSSIENRYSPSIRCTQTDSRAFVKLYYSGLKMFTTLSTEEMMFKHPEIDLFIKKMTQMITLLETTSYEN